MSPKEKDFELAGDGEQATGPSLEMGDELEAALQEASQAVDARKAEKKAVDADASPDKMMLEALSAELQAVKSEYEAVTGELAEQKDQYLRLQAEFENFRRRSMKERQEAFQFGHQNIVKDLLTSIDNLERATQHTEGSGGGDLEALLQGVELVSRELLGVFGSHGVTAIDAMNRPFDPALHEAMGQLEDASVPPNTVIQVLQTGYQLHDRMLRPAMVMVSKAPSSAKNGAKAAGRSAEESAEGETG